MSERTTSSRTMPTQPSGELSPTDVRELAEEFAAVPHNALMQNALSRQPIEQVALDRGIVTSIDHTFSNQLTDRKVTNQKKSGRCWLFAGLNLLRTGVSERLGVKDFELSQNYLLYWDKLEKANYFLENIIATADRDLDDRTVAHVLDTPTEDGGQWNMFVALVSKHGLVPQSVMPETEASSNTHPMNEALARILRKAARDLRGAVAAGAEANLLRKTKRSALADAHRLLTMHLGTPPQTFFWQWTDDEKTFHRDGDLTPQAFAERYLTVDPADYVCLVNDPRPSSGYGQTYTVDMLGNVVGGPLVTYLNVEIDEMRRLAMDAIVAGEPVWFGCDTGKMCSSELGMWDADLYDYDGVYATDSSMSKADRLLMHDSLMTHAMLFVGVDVVDGSPRKWRVENSWGEERGDKGLFTMNDNWFGEYVLEIAVHRDALRPELRAALDTEPVVLPAWDPMGALAR